MGGFLFWGLGSGIWFGLVRSGLVVWIVWKWNERSGGRGFGQLGGVREDRFFVNFAVGIRLFLET